MKLSKEKTVSQRQPGIPGPRSDDIGEFRRKLKEIYHSGGGSIRIYARTEENMPPRPAKFSLEDAIGQWDFLTSLREEFGDGWYYIIIYGSHGEVVGEYEFLLGGLPHSDTEDEEWEDEDLEDEDIEVELLQTMFEHYQKQREEIIKYLKS